MNEQVRRIGYIRTSITGQNADTQAEALQTAGCDSTNIHAASGSEPFATPTARRQLLDVLSNGGELIVYRLDRLSRHEHTLATFVQQLAAMGVTLIVASEAQRDDDEK